MITIIITLGSYLLTTGGVVQGYHVGELVVLLHQIKLLRNTGVVLEAVLSDLEHDLDHVLSPLVQGALVQDVSQSLEYRVYAAGRHLQI